MTALGAAHAQGAAAGGGPGAQRLRLRDRGIGHLPRRSEPRPVLTEQVGATAATTYDGAGNRSLVLFDRGDEIVVRAGEEGIRFLLVSGQPLEEPVAWHGPIVMNTPEELEQAFDELRNGTFVR